MNEVFEKIYKSLHEIYTDYKHEENSGFIQMCADAVNQVQEEFKDKYVGVGAYKQAAWERDVAVWQLRELGYEFGEKIREPKTNVDKIKSMTNEELAEWLNKYGNFEESPWTNWFDNNYCSNCEPEIVNYTDSIGNERDMQCAWCEIFGKCKFFQNMNNIPDNKQMIKMWLENECNECIE